MSELLAGLLMEWLHYSFRSLDDAKAARGWIMKKFKKSNEQVYNTSRCCEGIKSCHCN